MGLTDISKLTKTRFRSLVYRNGMIYNFLTQRLYDQKGKYSVIAKFIGNGRDNENNGMHVLDMPCGTGFLARYLHPSMIYEGWDLNHIFLRKIRTDWEKGRIRVKKVILRQKNIFALNHDGNRFRERKDVIVLCDILHHVIPYHLKLVELAKKNAKRVIICEPITVKRHEIQAHDMVGKLFVFLFKFLPLPLFKLLDFMIIDNDGINAFKTRSEWKYTEFSIKDLFLKLGFTKITKKSDSIIAMWG